MRRLIFDVETSPLPDSDLEKVIEPFDPALIKVGNIKDPALIEAKIEKARENHWADFVDKAALSPVTGQVLAIGIISANCEFTVIGDQQTEAETLTQFWDMCVYETARLNTMIGFNTHRFDLPFLVKRSWKLGVKVPVWIRHGRYWANEMIDLSLDWQMGDRESYVSLNTIAKHLGLGEKEGNGKDFYKLWANDRPAAISYLKQDLHLTAKIATIFGH